MLLALGRKRETWDLFQPQKKKKKKVVVKKKKLDGEARLDFNFKPIHGNIN